MKVLGRNKARLKFSDESSLKSRLIFVGIFAFVGSFLIILSIATSNPNNRGTQAEAFDSTNSTTTLTDSTASDGSYLRFDAISAPSNNSNATTTTDTSSSSGSSGSTGSASGTPGTGSSGSSGGSSGSVAGWTWPATLQNTGPASGTSFTSLSPREFGTSDNGKTFENVEILVGNGQEFYITGNNITFKNCRIVYTGNAHSTNGFIYIGKAWDSSIRPKNITFDHCYIDGGNRHEYGLTARHGQFTLQYSQVRGASHVVESAGDLDAGTTTTIYRNYIYDYDDTPYASPPHLGHANGIYFTGNNGIVNIEENTIIANRWELCNSGWSNGPGAGCYEFGGTGAITVYADEDSNPDKVYIVKRNQISGGGYYPVRFYGQTSGIQSITFTDNVFTAQAGWPKSSIDGNLYVFSGTIGSTTRTGNSWGSDTTCYSSPSSCAGTP